MLSHSRLDRLRRLPELLLGVAAAVLLFAMMLVTVVDVFGRYALSRPLPGAGELTGIMLALVIFVTLPLTCVREEHVVINVFTDRLSARARGIHESISALISATVLGHVAWQIFGHARRLASYGEVTTFLRVAKGPVGYVLALLVAVAAVACLLVAIDHLSRNETEAQ